MGRIVLQRRAFILLEAMISFVVVLGTISIVCQSVETITRQNQVDDYAINSIKEKYYQERRKWLTGADLH